MAHCRVPAITLADRRAFSIGEVAAMIGVAPATIYAWQKRGLIAFVRVGGRTFVSSTEVSRLMSAGPDLEKTTPAAAPATEALPEIAGGRSAPLRRRGPQRKARSEGAARDPLRASAATTPQSLGPERGGAR